MSGVEMTSSVEVASIEVISIPASDEVFIIGTEVVLVGRSLALVQVVSKFDLHYCHNNNCSK
jgi:hypothetical protein